MDIGNIESESKNSANEKQGFLQNLFGGLFKSSNPEAEKRRKLKAIAKSFSKTKYHAFYKPGSLELLPPFGKQMYDIYKLISPAQNLFKSNPNPNFFKHKILNFSMSNNQLEILSHFSEQSIAEASRKMPLDQIANQLESELEVFSSEFNSERIARTENLYKAFTVFRDFCCFDFYALIKKFYPALQENNFAAQPVFNKVNAEYMVDQLKDFCTIAYPLIDESIVWNDFFNFLKTIQPGESVSIANWKKIIARIRSIENCYAFEYMIRHISGDVKYKTLLPDNYETVVEPYLEKIQEETNAVIAKISQNQKASKASQICAQIFGNNPVKALKYYTDEANDTLAKKNLETFAFTEPLNYLKDFIVNFVKKDIREFYDLVVIRGQWDQTESAPFSNAYQELLIISDDITKFDNALAEEGTVGIKIKTLLPKTAHDAGAENIISRLISDSNDEARGFLVTATQDFITIGKILKQLIEDYTKKEPSMVMNWKELERYSEHPLKEFSINIYKRLYLFVQLMQTYLTK